MALAAALNAPAGAQSGEGQESDAPSAVQQCLNQPTIRRTKILNEGNIVFITRDGTIYNNQLPRQCPSLRRSSLVNYGIEHSRLCAGNSFAVLYRIGNNNYRARVRLPARPLPADHRSGARGSHGNDR